MSGASFAIIKKRIKSVHNTKKITKAMSLVATSKLRKNKEQLYINNQYKSSFDKIIRSILKDYEEENQFINGNGSNKKAYIIITSDLGLCGGYNGNIVSELNKRIKNIKEETLIFVIGQKGINSIKKLKYNIKKEYIDFPSIPRAKDAKLIAKDILELYISGEVGEINIIYTKFISTIKREVRVDRLFPVDKEELNETNFMEQYELEDLSILNELLIMYIEEKILNYMLHSKTSEESSRMEAMQSATKSADELLNKLNLQYNRLRQSAITQELAEIVGGAEAQR